MAIDPTTTTTVRVGELGSAAFNSTDLVPHEVSGVLKKGTLEDLAIFIASIIDVTGAIGFRAVQVSDGETLPATDEQEFILVGPGTYPNVGGGSAVTTTGSLNALVSNGTFWFIGVEIPIEVNGIWGDITGVLSDQTDLNDILEAKADLVGGKVPNSQLPSYVDDVVEVANYAALPGTGETGKIYVTVDTGNIYRWSGSAYIRIADESPVWGIITGTLSDQTDLQSALDGKFDVPTGDTTQYIAGDGSLITFPVAGQAGTLVRQVKNSTGSTLTKGTVVYINGASGNKPTVTKAIATGDSTSAQTFGLIQADLANNATGYVVCVGDIIGLDTSAFSEGTQLYLSSTTAGAYTSTKQYAPAHLVYIGVVTRSSSTLGQIEVRIQNGYELDELHDVAISSVANNEFIVYESSTSLWKNKNIGTVLGGTTLQFLKGNGDLDSNIYFKGSVTAGYLPKSLYPSSGDFTTSLIYDSGTNIGIGTTSPEQKLHVVGNGLVEGVILYRNGATNILNIGGDQNMYGGTNSDGGVFVYGNNKLHLSTNSARRLTVDGSGNVGIGTTSPSYKLDVAGVGRFLGTTPLTLERSGSTKYTFSLGASDDFYINNVNIGSTPLTILSSGNVGIGTTSPGAKLHVIGSSESLRLGTTTGDNYFTFFNSSGTQIGDIGYDGRDTNILSIWNNSNGGMLFGTNGSERMRITSGGNVGIGTTSPAAKLSISYSSAGSDAFSVSNTNTNGRTWYFGDGAGLGAGNFGFYDATAGASRLYINSSGSLVVNNLGTGLVYSNGGALTSTNPSDSRLKDNIVSLNYGLNEILQLRPVSYNWKDDKINQGKQFGFIAQEVQEVMPELVKEFETEEGNRLGLDKEGIYAALVNAIKELKAEIEILKNK